MQRALQQRRTDGIHIVQDPVFAKANNMLKAKCRLYAKNAETQNRKENQRSVTAISSRSAQVLFFSQHSSKFKEASTGCVVHTGNQFGVPGTGNLPAAEEKLLGLVWDKTGQSHLWCLQQLYYQHSLPQVDPGAGECSEVQFWMVWLDYDDCSSRMVVIIVGL